MQVSFENFEDDMQLIVDERIENTLNQMLLQEKEPEKPQVQIRYNRWNEPIYSNFVPEVQGPVFGSIPIRESFHKNLNDQLQQRSMQMSLSQNLLTYAKSNTKNYLDKKQIPLLQDTEKKYYDQQPSAAPNKQVKQDQQLKTPTKQNNTENQQQQQQSSSQSQSQSQQQSEQKQQQQSNSNNKTVRYRDRIHSFINPQAVKTLDDDISFVDYLDDPVQEIEKKEVQVKPVISDFQFNKIPDNLDVDDINSQVLDQSNNQKLLQQQIIKQNMENEALLNLNPQFIQKLHYSINTCEEHFVNMNPLEKLKNTLENDHIVDVSLVNNRISSNNPQNDIQIQREIVTKARDLLLPIQEVKKTQQQYEYTQTMLNEKESVINYADPTLEDLSNIVSERVNQFDLQNYIDSQKMEENAQKSIDKFNQYSDQSKKRQHGLINPYLENRMTQYIREQRFHHVDKDYKDAKCQVDPELITEETKWPSDWILEDLNYLRKAYENSYILLDNVPYSQQIRQQVKTKFENRLFDLLKRIIYQNDDSDRTKQEMLVILQQEIKNNFQSWHGKYIDGRLKLYLIKVFLEDYKNLAREHQYQYLINKMVDLDNIETYRLRNFEEKKLSYIKDFENGTKKLREYNQINEEYIEQKNINIVTRMLERKIGPLQKKQKANKSDYLIKNGNLKRNLFNQ